jgi:uncharacterized repeat protein (TIGR03803 family)
MLGHGRLASAAVTVTVHHSFGTGDGEMPGGLTLGRDGNYYGTTIETTVGPTYAGTIFRVAPDGTFMTVHVFSGTDGEWPGAGSIPGSAGGGSQFGASPMVLGNDGSLYGTTYAGGNNYGEWGAGTIFKFSPGGTLTTLAFFDGTNNASGPVSLLQASDGNFYGTTAPSWYGRPPSVFKMTPDGTLTTLFVFNSTNWPGYGAARSLIQATDGNLYGTTDGGGTYGGGTVFKVTPGGALTTLVSLNFPLSGSYEAPCSIMQASDGNFYVTTTGGAGGGHGRVLKITPAGQMSTLVPFGSTYAGDFVAGVVEGTDGNFYGTTFSGGIYDNFIPDGAGTIFQVTPAGRFTSLYRFDVQTAANPIASLLQVSDGTFYGTTSWGGGEAGGTGEVFHLTVPGAETPKIISAMKTAGGINVAWLALAGRSYQLQFAIDLAQTNWNNSGGTITATNNVITALETAGPDPQRFYRVVLLP